MAVEVVIMNPASKEEKDEEELSEEQIQSLLLEAETRLKKVSHSSGKKDYDDGVISLATGEVDDSASRPRIPNLNHTQSIQPYVQQSNSIAVIDKSKLVPESTKKLAETIHTVEQPLVKNKEKPNSGPKWFNLPKTVVTPELKRDLQILRMRSVLDPHRHYKKENAWFTTPGLWARRSLSEHVLNGLRDKFLQDWATSFSASFQHFLMVGLAFINNNVELFYRRFLKETVITTRRW
ncbi:rRNA-processing protein FCF2 [Microsporum canis CBS 113480]|uniref:rRNA-processing protein FCF2 n=1 Tax=Arthroderma otae (strain ATCC MYA-4605 / CBS 113480) TaxID=554155 RepID=C5FRF1_ARTOC|nr:rRNA-processing protein FCF2 [Microsporum canis CBS 113480]EEQ32454.1 rRNA-processing protein FCF2 [Microsporum canis CBS 113480]